MQNVSIQNASELPQAVLSAVEKLLGRAIAADEEISIAATPPQRVPPSEGRAAVARKLQALLDRRADRTSDVADEQIDMVLDDALREARHRG